MTTLTSAEGWADLAARRTLGQTGLQVTSVCIGGGPLGGSPAVFGHETAAQDAVATVLAGFDSPFNFIDTSSGYTDGESERRIGAALAQVGGLPAGWVLETKVDPDFVTGEFDGPAVRRSFEGSLERLGVDHIELLHFHDPERITFEEAMAPGGAVPELVKLRDEGLVDHLGVAGGPSSLLERYLDTGVFEAVLTHNRWTLADRSAGHLLDKATALGVGVLNGAPFGGGVLAKGTGYTELYCYAPMRPQTRAAIQAVEAICSQAGVPLGAAALQFSLRDPRIHSTVVGVAKPERIRQTVAWATWPVPDDVWQAILAASGRDAGLDN
ncbi:MAG: aldo/keto reductase [Bifidobacteriaceae bacterium]|jgi:D-threo-aldose 1-dehydrogenase|nr:aldo/keto reductase [Bifidobacteriaceae bacterium]